MIAYLVFPVGLLVTVFLSHFDQIENVISVIVQQSNDLFIVRIYVTVQRFISLFSSHFLTLFQ